MNKTTLAIGFLMVLLCTSVLGYSNASIYTVDELSNLTRADNFLEVSVEVNNLLGGLFGTFIWVAVIVLSYLGSIYFTQNTTNAFVFSAFTGSVTAVFLYFIRLGDALTMQLSIIALIIAVFTAVTSK